MRWATCPYPTSTPYTCAGCKGGLCRRSLGCQHRELKGLLRLGGKGGPEARKKLLAGSQLLVGLDPPSGPVRSVLRKALLGVGEGGMIACRPLAAPRWRRQSTNPPVDMPASGDRAPQGGGYVKPQPPSRGGR